MLMTLSVIGGVLGVAILVSLWLYGKRGAANEWKQFAETNGFHPVTGKLFTSDERIALPFLLRGFGRKFISPHERMINGTLVRVFDYEYSFGAPFVANVSYRQTVIAMRPQAINLPDFQLEAATTLDRLWGRVSGRHIRPYHETNFSNRYVLRGQDRFSILALFRAEIVQAVEYQNPGTEWSMESGAGWMLFYRWKEVVPKSVLMDVIVTNGYFANLITNQNLIPQPTEEDGCDEELSPEYDELVRKMENSPLRER